MPADARLGLSVRGRALGRARVGTTRKNVWPNAKRVVHRRRGASRGVASIFGSRPGCRERAGDVSLDCRFPSGAERRLTNQSNASLNSSHPSLPLAPELTRRDLLNMHAAFSHFANIGHVRNDTIEAWCGVFLRIKTVGSRPLRSATSEERGTKCHCSISFIEIAYCRTSFSWSSVSAGLKSAPCSFALSAAYDIATLPSPVHFFLRIQIVSSKLKLHYSVNFCGSLNSLILI